MKILILVTSLLVLISCDNTNKTYKTPISDMGVEFLELTEQGELKQLESKFLEQDAPDHAVFHLQHGYTILKNQINTNDGIESIYSLSELSFDDYAEVELQIIYTNQTAQPVLIKFMKQDLNSNWLYVDYLIKE